MSEKMLFTGERYIPEYFSDSNDEIVKEHEDRYKTITELITDKVVLDAACGSGYGSFEISKHAKSIIGIDISEDSVAYAKNNFLAENLNFEVASVTEIPFDDNEFEVVVSFETIEHISENQQVLFLKQIKRVLKEDGILIISTPDKLIYSDKKNYKNEFHIKEFYEKEFYSFLSNFFKNVEFYYQKQEVCNLIYNKDSLEMSFSTNSEEISGKYIIAICSDIDLKALKKIGSISIEDTKNDFLNTRILSLQDEVNEKNQWAFNLNSEISKINLILKQKEFDIRNLNQELEQRENKYLKLEEEKNQIELSLKSNIKTLNQELEQRENKYLKLEEEKNQIELSLKSNIKTLNQELEQRENKYLKLEEEKNQIELSLKSNIKTLNQELEQRENKYLKLEEEKNQIELSLKSNIKTLNQELEQRENKYLKLEEEKNQIELSLKSNIKILNEKYEEENNSTNDRIKDLEEEIYKIYTSNSWKIMRFPRRIFRIIKSLRRK